MSAWHSRCTGGLYNAACCAEVRHLVRRALTMLRAVPMCSTLYDVHVQCHVLSRCVKVVVRQQGEGQEKRRGGVFPHTCMLGRVVRHAV